MLLGLFGHAHAGDDSLGQRFSLVGQHKFMPGDDPAYAEPGFNDSDWQLVPVPSVWEEFGVPGKQEVGWYRLYFEGEDIAGIRNPALHLGLVLQADEVYLNGRKIGGKGAFASYHNSWRHLPGFNSRLYRLPEDFIRYQQANVLAIRVAHVAYLNDGGIAKAPVDIVDYFDAQPEFSKQQQYFVGIAFLYLGIDLVVLFFLFSALLMGLTDKVVKIFTLMYVFFFLAQQIDSHIVVDLLEIESPLYAWALSRVAALLVIPFIEFVAAVFQYRITRAMRVLQIMLVILACSGGYYSTPFGEWWYLFTLQAWYVVLLIWFLIIAYWLVQAVRENKPGVWPMLLGLVPLLLVPIIEMTIGTHFIFQLTGYPVANLTHRLFIFSLVVVVAIRLLNIERQLQHANISALQAHAQERRRLARDVHDGIGQWLSTIKLNLQLLKADQQQSDRQTAQRYDELVDNVSEAIKEARAIAHDLSPALLEKQGLLGAIRSHADRVRQDKAIKIQIDADEHLSLSKFAGEHLYRVFQEAVRNAIVHGRADRINVDLKLEHDLLLFSIQDNGVGIQEEQRAAGQHMGLNNIGERVTMLGGEFTLQTAAAGGVEVLIKIPGEKCVER